MASKPDHEKPLPTLPKKHDAPKLTTLSVEARNHARRFIIHALEEESTAITGNDWNGDNDAWADGLLDSLDSLGDGVANGGWIVGANRLRRASAQRKLAQRNTKEVETTTTTTAAATATADAVVEPKNIAIPDVSEHGADPPPPKPTPGTAMEQILLWVSKTLPPSPKPYAKHILLTVSVYGHVPDNISDFEFVPSAVGCAFLPSRFTLPSPASSSKHAEYEEGIILYGLDEWDGQFSSSIFNSPAKSHYLTP